MGLFDEVVGAFLKGDAGKYQAILSWVEEQGGIQVLLEMAILCVIIRKTPGITIMHQTHDQSVCG